VMLKPLASDPASDPAAAAYDMLITRTKKRFQPVTFLGFLLGKYCFTTITLRILSDLNADNGIW